MNAPHDGLWSRYHWGPFQQWEGLTGQSILYPGGYPSTILCMLSEADLMHSPVNGPPTLGPCAHHPRDPPGGLPSAP